MELPISNIMSEIHDYLESFPHCSEHDLIKHLEEQNISPYDDTNLRSTEGLFKLHFLTMHALYRLQHYYSQDRKQTLFIELTRIERRPLANLAANELGRHDPVRDYYLDMENFYTSTDEVDDLLKGFWEKYFAYFSQDTAYTILGLTVGASLQEVKQRYRELAKVHHPDRGGDAKRFIEITEAKEALEKALT